MYTDAEILEICRRRSRVLIPTVCISILAMCGYFGAMPWLGLYVLKLMGWRVGESAPEWLITLLILPAFPIFLVPCMIAERRVKRHSVVCPTCSASIFYPPAVKMVLKTRCCPECQHRIVEGGRVRSERVYKRYLRLKERHFLRYWLWLWPTLCVFSLCWYVIDPSASIRESALLLAMALLATAATGWAWLRTFDHRYFLVLAASTALLVIGLILFCRDF